MTSRPLRSLEFLVLALAVAACSAPKGDGLVQTTPSSSVPPASSTAPASGTAHPAPLPAPKGWKAFAYSKIGLNFWFPPLPGQTNQGADASSNGPRYRWTIKRSDRCDPRGTCRTYEFAAMNDGCPEAPAFPTFAHRWKESDGKHSISTCDGDDSFEIEPLRIVTRADRIRGVIFDANAGLPSSQKIPGALAAVLNFPKGFHKNYEAIAFYFEDPTSLDTVETVLRLVTLDV